MTGREVFQECGFRTWWFEIGTQTFLVEQLAERGFFIPDLYALRASEALLSRFDVDRPAPEALFWQTG